MKLSKTQVEILEKAKRTLEVLRKYENFTQFFDNSRYEQNYLTTAAHCNSAYNSSTKYKQKDFNGWLNMEKSFNLAVNESIIIVFAKTESIKKLENAGFIKIIEEAKYNGGAETIKIL